MSKQKIWELIEAYRTSGGSEEHHARKELLDAALDKALTQPAVAEQHKQEPVAWRNAAIRVGEDLCSVGPFGYYDMTAAQWLDWALSVVTVHAPPAQRKPLDIKTIKRIATYCGEHITDEDVIEITRRVEEEHSIKE